MKSNKEYFAFVSYQREDEEWAKWLADQLEHYHLPLTDGHEDLPTDLRPIFRDIDELAAGYLPRQIHQALENSKNLIVVCSPNSAKSPWVNKEVETFIGFGKLDNIFPFIIEGVPFSKNKDEECFPDALRKLSDDKERLGASIKEYKDGPQRLCKDCPLPKDKKGTKKQGNIGDKGPNAAVVKIIAGMLGLNFDTLWQRYEKEKVEEERRIKEQRDKLLIAQSRFLAEKASALVDDGDAYTARLIAYEALPKDSENPERPYVIEAEAALRKAFQSDTGLLRGHEDTVNALSSFGHILLSGSSDRMIRIWDLNTGACVRVLYVGERITALFCDGKTIIAGTEDGFVCVWDFSTGVCIKKWKAHSWRVNTIIGFKRIIVSGSNDLSLCYWNIINEDCKKKLEGYGFAVYKNTLISYTRDKIFIYDFANGGLRKEKVIPSSLFRISNVAFDGQIIATGHTSGEIYLWDIDSEGPIGCLKGHEHEITSMAFDENYLVSGSKDKTIRIWNLDDKTCHTVLEGHEGGVVSLIVTQNHIVSSSRDYTVRIWDKHYQNDCIDILDCGESCVVASSKRLLVSGFGEHSNKSVFVWDLKEKTQIGSLRTGPGDPSSLFVNDSVIICGSYKTIKIWDTRNLELRGIFKGHDGQINAIAYNGEIVASGSWDNDILLWDLKNQTCINTLHGHQDSVRALTFCGEYLISGSDDHTIRIWNIQTGRCLRNLNGHQDRITALAAVSDRVFVSGSLDSSIRVWDIETGCCMSIIREHSRVFSLVSDGKSIISGTEDSMNVWDAKTGTRLLTSSSPIVHSVAYDGSKIYAGLYYSSAINIRQFPSLENILVKMRSLSENRSLTPEERKKYYLD